MPENQQICIKTTEMHTCGDPVRIVESGFPMVQGETIAKKRKYVQDKLKMYMDLLINEPRGHLNMCGNILVEPDNKEADIAVIFFDVNGCITMCGHQTIALARYAVDKGYIKDVSHPETEVKIQVPCGMVTAYVHIDEHGNTGKTRFRNVEAFVFATGIEVFVEDFGNMKIDISFGGNFFGILEAKKLGMELGKSSLKDIVKATRKVTEAIKTQVVLHHPFKEGMNTFLGVILTDGQDTEQHATHLPVLDSDQVVRSPCGSGTTARVALQYYRKQINLNQTKTFQNAITRSRFQATPVEEIKFGNYTAVLVEIEGKGNYTGSAEFVLEEDPEDLLAGGFQFR